MTRRACHVLAYALLPIVLFAAWLHLQTLSVTNIGWTIDGHDWGANSMGLAAYLQNGNWPGTQTPLLLAPDGAHLLMTDSNPLLGLLIKPFARWLPAGIQFLGWWLLACLTLHVIFARLLVRHYLDDEVAVWIGTALLTLLPTLYVRLPHPNLCAHWIILWALWLFVDRARSRALSSWMALIGVAGLVHSYLLVLVGAIWASAGLRDLLTGRASDRRRVAIAVGAVVAELAALLLIHGLTEPPSATTSYGAFPMPIDAMINPGMSGYAALLPSSKMASGVQHVQMFEGFQYLGAGLLTLLAVALFISWGQRHDPQVKHGATNARSIANLYWLIPAYVVLTLLAIGNLPILHGARYMIFALPQRIVDALDLVRASGRLFWPVAYTIVLGAIIVIGRMRRGVPIMAAALLLQVIDISPMFQLLRAETARATEPEVFRRLTDPRWEQLVASSSQVEVEPPNDVTDRLLLEEIGWRAVLGNRPIRFMYVARITPKVTRRLAADRRAFLKGGLDLTRLYVILPGEQLPSNVAARTTQLDGVEIIAPIAAITRVR